MTPISRRFSALALAAVLTAPAIALAQSSTLSSAPRSTSTIKPFSLSNDRNKGVSVTVSWQIELPFKKNDMEDQLATVEKGRKAFYAAIKRECEMLREVLASECKLATMRVSNSTRKIRGTSNSQYISGSATFKLKLKDK